MNYCLQNLLLHISKIYQFNYLKLSPAFDYLYKKFQQHNRLLNTDIAKNVSPYKSK